MRFLNEAIEGTISRVLANDRVEVTDSDGFTHISEQRFLVRVEFELDSSQSLPEKENISEAPAPPPMPSPRKSSPEDQHIISALDADETIYAAIRLHNEKFPLTTDIDLILVNNTSYQVLFSASRQLEDFRSGVDSGILKSRTEHFLGVFSQDELHRFNGFEFQFLFFGEQEFRPRSPVTKSLSFTSSDFLDPALRGTLRSENTNILMMPLYSFNALRELDVSKLLEKYQQRETEEKLRNTPKPGKGKTEKFTILSRTKVVDLHIEELLKDYSGMSNAQIISYQLNYFMYEMDQALMNKLHKITFIHGVGQGVLKSAIREELKKVPNIRYGEAPAEQYGFGATEVVFL